MFVLPQSEAPWYPLPRPDAVAAAPVVYPMFVYWRRESEIGCAFSARLTPYTSAEG